MKAIHALSGALFFGLVFGLLFGLVFAPAGVAAAESAASAENAGSGRSAEDPWVQLLTLSGAETQLLALPAQFVAGLRGSMGLAPDGQEAQLAPLIRAVDQSFDADASRAGLLARMRETLSRADVEVIAAWLESDLGTRIIEAEVAAADPAVMPEIMRVANSMMSDAQRLARSTRIVELADVTDYLVDTQKRVAGATFIIAASRMSPGEATDPEAFLARLDEAEPAIRFQLGQVLLASTLYTYRDLDHEDLDRYISFLETPEARRFSRIVHGSIMVANDQLIAGVLEELDVQARGLFERFHSGPA